MRPTEQLATELERAARRRAAEPPAAIARRDVEGLELVGSSSSAQEGR